MTSDLLASIRTDDWLAKQNFPPTQWVVPEMIPEGYTVLAGPPKVGKSWLVLQLLYAVATGGCALGVIDVTTTRPVLYLALEDSPARLQNRLDQVRSRNHASPKFHFATGADMPPDQVLEVVSEWLDKHKDDRPVVCIDTLGKIIQPAVKGQGAYERDYALGSQIKRLVDTCPGSSVIAVHHTRKQAADDWMDGVSGTNGVNGAADSTLSLARGRGDADGVLHFTGRDIESDGTVAVIFDGPLWRLSGSTVNAAKDAARTAAATVNVGDRSAEIVLLVGEHPDGISPKQVAEALGLDAKNAASYLSRLEKSGRIRRSARGRYVPTPPL